MATTGDNIHIHLLTPLMMGSITRTLQHKLKMMAFINGIRPIRKLFRSTSEAIAEDSSNGSLAVNLPVNLQLTAARLLPLQM